MLYFARLARPFRPNSCRMPDQSTPTWRAKPRCPRHLVAVLERAVNALPSEWLLPPRTGEIFDSIEHCRRRLQGYSLAEGFEVVQTGGGTSAANLY